MQNSARGHILVLKFIHCEDKPLKYVTSSLVMQTENKPFRMGIFIKIIHAEDKSNLQDSSV